MADTYTFYGFQREEACEGTLTSPVPQKTPIEVEIDIKALAHRLIDAIASDDTLHAKLRIALEYHP
jgi:hypothetical protein